MIRSSTPVRAAFFDVDDTLLSHRTGRVPESAVRALLRLHGAGVLLFLATGRHMLEMRDLCGILGLPWNGFVTLNGQLCTDGKRPFHALPIDPQDVRRLVEATEAMDIPCMFAEADRIYVNRHDDAVRGALAAIHTPLPPTGELRRGLSHAVYLAVTYCGPERQAALMARLEHARCSQWNPHGFDILHRDGDKALGIRKTCEVFGIAPEEALAFGDAANDVGMLRAAGIGVAMGNGSVEARAAADFIAPDIDDDGVARALRSLGIL